ncbi:hypothetical protein HK097_006992 [Rhizophlyctis rosea]|uniref:Chitinase n=1 Tax=Rhizophlyctis rosea TaxID=64517 RepID=A0AAD5SE22_9FUNG|nr:hypothetical protein HK097_006992 [Rhizophlyctis rosea]
MCKHKIWPAIQGAKDYPVPADGGFGMAPGITVNVKVPENWISGRVWARTNCKVNNGKVFCETGTCGIPENNYGVPCQGNGGIPPYTIAEFTLKGWNNLDYYDVSQVDGHNIGVSISVLKGDKINDAKATPPHFDCGNPACRFDINKNCPPELTFKSTDRKRTIACGSINNAITDLVQRTFNPDPLVPWYEDMRMRMLLGCVHPDFGYSHLDVRDEAKGKVCLSTDWPKVQNSGPWPDRYDEVFKQKCPDAYSWQFDDMSSTYNCRNADYQITFCPPAECGKDAGGKTCPNNYCCSSYGVCGLGKDVCGAGCQSQCNGLDDFPPPDHCDNGALSKVVAYYSNSGATRGQGLPNCNGVLPAVPPEKIRTTGVTHLVYVCDNPLRDVLPLYLSHIFEQAFGAISPQFGLTTTRGDDDLIRRFNGLKNTSPGLKTLWAIGGWNFNSLGSGTETRFSDAVTFSANRKLLVDSVINTIPAKGFDGVDFDWEWPGKPYWRKGSVSGTCTHPQIPFAGVERGGRETDPENYVQFIKELRAAANAKNMKLLIALTVPGTMADKLNKYDLKQLQKDADWINVMTYDFNGASPGGVGAPASADLMNQALQGGYNSLPPASWPTSLGVQPHTSLVDVDNALKAFLKAGVRREKLVMGIAFYGRNYQLSNPSCDEKGCPFTAAGAPGVCTNTPGFLSYNEILDQVQKHGGATKMDDKSYTESAVVNNQWISYETPQTIEKKMILANNQCVNGVSVWSLDLDPAGLLLLSIYGHSNTVDGANRESCMKDGEWPTTKVGSVSSHDCPYGGGKITRKCGSGGKWEDIKNECDDASTTYLGDDFKKCKNGPTVDMTGTSLGIDDVNRGGNARRRRSTDDLPARPARSNRERLEVPVELEKRQASSTTTTRAASAPTDLWSLMKANAGGGNLPHVAGIFGTLKATASPTPTGA